jgi:hypothetical protein
MLSRLTGIALDRIGVGRRDVGLIETVRCEHGRCFILHHRARPGLTLSVLAGGIAHDFNNLLTVVPVNIELAKLPIVPPPRFK